MPIFYFISFIYIFKKKKSIYLFYLFIYLFIYLFTYLFSIFIFILIFFLIVTALLLNVSVLGMFLWENSSEAHW